MLSIAVMLASSGLTTGTKSFSVLGVFLQPVVNEFSWIPCAVTNSLNWLWKKEVLVVHLKNHRLVNYLSSSLERLFEPCPDIMNSFITMLGLTNIWSRNVITHRYDIKVALFYFSIICHFKVLALFREPNLGIQMGWPQQSGCHSDCTACQWPLLCRGTARSPGRTSATQRQQKSTRRGSTCPRLRAGSDFPAVDRTHETSAEHLASMNYASYLPANQSWINLCSRKDMSLAVIAKEELFSPRPIPFLLQLSGKQWCCWETLMAKCPGVEVTLQRHSPDVLLQSLWKPRLVSQLQGPHAGLPHHPWGQGFFTLASEKTQPVTRQLHLILQEWLYRNMALVWMTLKYHEVKIKAGRVAWIRETGQTARLICVAAHLKQTSAALEGPGESDATQLKPTHTATLFFFFWFSNDLSWSQVIW